MRAGLIDFKKEVEVELLQAKQIFINAFAEKFIERAPLPSKTITSTGFFVNQTNFTIGNREYHFNVNLKSKINRSKKFTSVHSGMMGVSTGNITFKVNNPYDKISITNYVYYGDAVENIGWRIKGPYAPFKKSYKYSLDKLKIFLNTTPKRYR